MKILELNKQACGFEESMRESEIKLDRLRTKLEAEHKIEVDLLAEENKKLSEEVKEAKLKSADVEQLNHNIFRFEGMLHKKNKELQELSDQLADREMHHASEISKLKELVSISQKERDDQIRAMSMEMEDLSDENQKLRKKLHEMNTDLKEKSDMLEKFESGVMVTESHVNPVKAVVLTSEPIAVEGEIIGEIKDLSEQNIQLKERIIELEKMFLEKSDVVPVHDEADGKEVKKKSGDNNELEQKWKQLEFVTGVTAKIKKDDAFARSRSISESSKDSSHDRSSDLEFLSLSETRSIPAHENKLTPDGGKQLKDELERLSKVQIAMVRENELLLNQNEELKDEVKALTKTVEEQSRYMRQIENGEIIVRRGKIVFETPSKKSEDSNKHRDSDESSVEGRGHKKNGSDDAEDSEINESESDDECGFATITGGDADDDNEEGECREHLFKIKHLQKRHKQLKIENEELKKEIDLLKKKKQSPSLSGHRESKNAELMSTNLELIAEKEHMGKRTGEAEEACLKIVIRVK